MKKKIAAALFILFNLCITYNSFADLIATEAAATVTPPAVQIVADGFIEIKSKVPDGFERGIIINMFSENGYNTLYTLNKIDGFTLKRKISAGKYKIDYIMVLGDSKKAFKVDSPKEVVITANAIAEFPISVNHLQTAEEATKYVGSDTQSVQELKNSETAKEETISNSAIQSIPKSVQTDKQIPPKEVKVASPLKVAGTYIFTIVLAVILIIVALVIRLRRVRYSDE